MARVDDEDFIEIVRQIFRVAAIIDDLADRPIGRHRDQFALHQPAGRILRERQALEHGGTVRCRDRGQHIAAALLVQGVDQFERVVALELFDGRSDDLGCQGVEHVLEHGAVKIHQHVRVEPGAEKRRQLAPVVARQHVE